MIPRPMPSVAGNVVCLLLIPPAVIARIRATNSPGRPVHIFWDMDMQSRFNPQSANPLFEDGRAMRPIVLGTVAQGEANLDPHLMEGAIRKADGTVGWADGLPKGLVADEAFLRRGQERFNIYCALCHGYAGFGDGIVNKRAMALMNLATGVPDGTAWVVAKSLHDETVRPQPIGQIFHSLSYGIRTMAGYSSQISIEDRWAIAAYVKALQLSQNASLQDVPSDRRDAIGPGPTASSAGGATNGGTKQ